jgi:peptidyl-prolyl cis-trans isomerase SurA
MTKEEAMEELRADVREDILAKTIAEQRQKTKIVIEPSFNAELEKNFKK